MCYSALVTQAQKKLERMFEAEIDVPTFEATFEARLQDKSIKLPKAMEDDWLAEGGRCAELVADWRDRQVQDLERLRAEQRERLAKAEAKLAVKETKAALNDQRVATNKIRQFGQNLDDLERTAPKERDSRIWPGVYTSVVAHDDGARLVRPMRYRCRMPGWNAEMEAKYPGTYNARRDSLDSSWKRLFGKQHAIMVIDAFYESVDRDGKAVELEFSPRTGEPMLVPCLWSYHRREKLYSVAAITDDPEEEVAAAGHDRTVLNLHPDQVDAWLAGGTSEAMHQLFDRKRHPYYEHRPSRPT